MERKVRRLPWQPELPGNVTCHVVSHVTRLVGFYPCFLAEGTGKLRINVIYNKCHYRSWTDEMVLASLYYFLGDQSDGFRLAILGITLCDLKSKTDSELIITFVDQTLALTDIIKLFLILISCIS